MSEKRPRSFYSNALDEAERQELKSAVALEGIDDEIAVMRVQIKKLIRADDLEELARCTNALCRMLMTRYTVEGKAKKGIREAISNVLRDIAVPLGVAIMTKKL
jgi:CBS-domain-containing membrane protein